MIKEILIGRYGQYLDGLDIYENDSSLILSRIVIKPEARDGGIGTRIMNDLVIYADSNNQIVALTPSSDFGGNKNKLVQFYKRFGFKYNKGHYKSYEFRDTMIRYPKMNENMKNNEIRGGLADNKTKKDIANKFNVTLSKIESQIRKGVRVEKEHTKNKSQAEEIAMDHLVEIPDYYTRLEKMEKDAKKDWDYKVNESTRDLLKRLIREQVELSVTDETNEITSYNVIYNDRYAGVLVLGSFNKSIPKDAVELVLIKLSEKYTGLLIGHEIVKKIWAENPNTNQIYLTPTLQSEEFWGKMGARRLNDTYSVIRKGHA